VHRLLLAAFILLAAGLASRAQAQAAPVEGDWTGPYVGLSAGVKLGDVNWTATQLNGGGGGGTPFTPVDATSPRNHDLTAARLGGFAGFGWQAGPWVFGPEAGFAWSDAQQTRAFLPGCGLGCSGFIPPPGPNDTASARLLWDGHVGARGGYLLLPQTLLYGTAGLALQQVETTGACINPSIDSQYCFGPGPQPPIKRDLTLIGFSIGGGVETALAPNWRLRGEYRFAHFPEVGDTLPFPPSTTGRSNTYRYRLSADSHVLSMGLVYRF
jgi:outer membrane immunogenic protein